MIRRPPRSTLSSSSAASDVYKRQMQTRGERSVVQSAGRIIAQGTLYQGLSSGMVAMGGTMFIFFWSHSLVKATLLSVAHTPVLSPSLDVVAGTLAGTVCAVASEPMWMINARLMVDPEDPTKARYTGIVDCINTVLRKEGIGAMFAGVGGAFGTVLASAVQLSCYEQFKKFLAKASPRLLESAAAAFLLGALCKCLAVLVTFPLTTVGSRMQSQRNEGGSQTKVRYKGTMDCFFKMVAQEGVGSLFAGLRAKLMQQFLQNGFRFMFYERIVAFLLRLLRVKTLE
eukprot:TRINITY_DN25156_c0_g1_i1.p1 TRINITY_DN25156_c0_g1~~TRINITY_DN25156_c0_g1_i1.p1  ORF type:complete len:285 (+),score=66.86 TRINITY_DN25156_c0_g1_i1:126-980(+)